MARIVCIVAMKLTPVTIVEKPTMKMPTTVGTTAVGAIDAVRRVEGPAGVDAAAMNIATSTQIAPTTKM